jgi:transcriptional regulator with XRE-family HTH domain
MTRWDRYYKRQMENPKMRKLVQEELADLEIGIKIARLREQADMNQTELAARAGMNASKISRIETSARNVTVATLHRIAHALGSKLSIDFVSDVESKPIFATRPIHSDTEGKPVFVARSARARSQRRSRSR